MDAIASRWLAMGGLNLIMVSYLISGELKHPGRLSALSVTVAPSLVLIPLFMGSWGLVALAMRRTVQTARARTMLAMIALVYFALFAGLTAYVISLDSSTAGLGFMTLPLMASAVMLPLILTVRWFFDHESAS